RDGMRLNPESRLARVGGRFTTMDRVYQQGKSTNGQSDWANARFGTADWPRIARRWWNWIRRWETGTAFPRKHWAQIHALEGRPTPKNGAEPLRPAWWKRIAQW